jgi:predicted RNA-binding protein with PIN domain
LGSDDPLQLVVDGDNLIGSWKGPQPGDDRRDEVVRRVSAVCERRAATATVVFDRGRAPAPRPRVTVQVAGAEEEADDLIRAIVDGATAPANLTVVSSDKPLYSYARTRGARILRAHEWSAFERGE